MKYSEHPADPALAERIECIWIAEDADAAPAAPERVLPDGCLEWIFHLGSPYADGSGRPQAASFLASPTTGPLEIAPTGPVSTMGVRFRPGGARRILPPLSLFHGAFPTSEEAWGGEGRSVQEEVGNAPDFRARRAVVERFLEKRLERARASSSRLPAAVGLVLAQRGRLPVGRIAERIGCSRRQLEREFAEGVGLSPKELSRIARFQNVLRLAGRNPAAGWADLAARCGYADQAHLVREFRSFSGATPSSRDALSGTLARYFIDPARLDMLLSPSGGRSATPEPPPVAFLQDLAGPPV